MRYTYPALITASVRLCRRYKNSEHLVRRERRQLVWSIEPIFLGGRLAQQSLKYS